MTNQPSTTATERFALPHPDRPRPTQHDEEIVSPAGHDGVDMTKPVIAQVLDYILGGGRNFALDRISGERLLASTPTYRDAVRHTRQFMRRAVREVAERGVVQFLDLGAGIPTVVSTHEIAQELAPDAHVVYVDNSPVVVSSLELLTAGDERLLVIHEDLSDPGMVLNWINAQSALDFSQPVCVLMNASLHHLADDAATSAISSYLDAICAGSYLAISHLTADLAPESAAVLQAMHERMGAPLWPRSSQWLEQCLADLDILSPGVAHPDHWRPDSPLESDSPALHWSAVATKLSEPPAPENSASDVTSDQPTSR